MANLEVSINTLKKLILEEMEYAEDSKFLEFLMKQVIKQLSAWDSFDIDYNVQKKLFKAISKNLSSFESDKSE